MEPSGFEGPGGALVEEAKKLMQEEDEPAPVENAGPKIRMGKLGRKGKKGAPGAGGAAAEKGGPGKLGGLDDYKSGSKTQGGAFSE